MRNPTKSMFAGSLGAAVAVGVIGVAALFVGPFAAKSTDRPPPPPANPQAQPGPDRGFIVKPPDHGNPRLVKPAPPDRDPGLVKNPPADTKDAKGAKNAKPDESKAPSRQDDCRGTAKGCKQNSPR